MSMICNVRTARMRRLYCTCTFQSNGQFILIIPQHHGDGDQEITQQLIITLNLLFAYWIGSESVASEALADYLKWQVSCTGASGTKLLQQLWFFVYNILNIDKRKSDLSETNSQGYSTSSTVAAMTGRRFLNAFLIFNFFLVIAGLLSYRAIYSARSKEPIITESALKAHSGSCFYKCFYHISSCKSLGSCNSCSVLFRAVRALRWLSRRK